MPHLNVDENTFNSFFSLYFLLSGSWKLMHKEMIACSIEFVYPSICVAYICFGISHLSASGVCV